jgi:hypothetical protein
LLSDYHQLAEIQNMKKTKQCYRSRSFGRRIRLSQLATVGIALSVALQGLLPFAAAADNLRGMQQVACAMSNPSIARVLGQANPTRGMQEEEGMTDEEFEAYQKKQLAKKELEAKTEADNACVVQAFAATINRLPVLATATVGAALNKGASLQEGLSAIDPMQVAHEGSEKLSQVKFAESVKKPVLQVVADAELSSGNGRLMIADPEQPLADNKQVSQALGGGDAVDQLTGKTIQKLIELERLNTYFRIETTRQSKWRKWRTWLVDEQLNGGIAGMTLIYIVNQLRALSRGVVFNTTIHVSSTTIFPFGHVKNIYLHGNFYRNPPNSAMELAFYGTIPFISVAIAQESFELLENFYDDWKTKRHGFDPASTKPKAIALRDEIDGLLAQRNQAIGTRVGGGQDQEILSAEGKVLKDLRDLELDEYGRYYSAARRARPVQNAYYIPEIMQRGVALSAAITGTVAQQRQEVNIFGAFGVLQVVGAVLQIASPVAAVLTNKIQKERAAKALVPVLTGQQIHTVEELDTDRKHFEDLALAATGQPQFEQHATAYKLARDNAAASLALSRREEAAAKSLFKTAFLLKSFAAGMLTSYGVISMVGGYSKITNLRHLGQMGLAAALQLEILTMYGFVDGLVRFPYNEMKLQKAKKAGLLPGQVLTARIDNLDHMETIVSGKIISPPKPQ